MNFALYVATDAAARYDLHTDLRGNVQTWYAVCPAVLLFFFQGQSAENALLLKGDCTG